MISKRWQIHERFRWLYFKNKRLENLLNISKMWKSRTMIWMMFETFETFNKAQKQTHEYFNRFEKKDSDHVVEKLFIWM